jgi:small-conductance mechanosensitive channel
MFSEKKKRKIPFSFFAKIIVFVILLSLFFYAEGLLQHRWVNQVFRGLSTFLIPSIIFSIIRVTIISLYNARHANRSVRGNFVLGINRLTTILDMTFLIIGIMVAFGINPVNFLTSLTIVAMAIALIFREYITNMLSGLFIMFSEQFSVGDRIQVGEHKGRIVDVTFAHIEIQNEEDDIVMIPNNTVFTNPVLNLSAHRSHLFTVKFELPLQTAANVLELEKEIREILRNHPNLDKANTMDLEVVEIGKDFIRYKVELYAVSSSNRLHKQLENELMRSILDYENRRIRSSEL